MSATNPELGKEFPSPKEAEYTAEIVEILRDSLIKTYPQGKKLKRIHTKSIGCVNGEFIVHDNIPDYLQIGLFANPASYKAIIRLSNGPHKFDADNSRCARGMAMKILETSKSPLMPDEYNNAHDLMFTTSTVLFPGTVKLYKTSLKELFKNKLYAVLVFLNLLNWSGLKSIFKGRTKVANVPVNR